MKLSNSLSLPAHSKPGLRSLLHGCYCRLAPLGLLACLLAGLVSPASAGAPLPVDMVAERVSAHVYYVKGASGIATDNYGFVSNSAFVVTGEGVVVFDTLGTPALGAKLLAVIRSITDAPITTVYISHYHADHVYGTQVFADAGAEIVAADGAKRYLEGETARQRLLERRQSLAPWVDENTYLVHPDRYLQGEETVKLGGVSMRVVNVGSAHSEGDLILFVEDDRVLLSGDIIFEGRIPFLGNANSDRWLEVLTEMQDVEARAVIPGHGAAAAKPQEIVALTANYLAFVREAMQQAVDDWIPFDEAYEATDWGDFIDYPAFLEANRRNAYSIFLSLEQESLRSN